MARGKKRSRGPDPDEEQRADPTFCASVAADDYFASGAQKLKKATDNSALLELASQHASGYRDLLSGEEIIDAETAYAGRFRAWKTQLENNFSLMLYGYGCKRGLVSRFINDSLHDGAIVVVYGRQKRISAKQIIYHVAESMLPSGKCSKRMSHDAMISYIRDSPNHVHLAIHNLDSPYLRNSTDQSALSRLARCRNVRLIATIDNPMISLTHSFDEAEGFGFLWHHVPTFSPLLHETLKVPAILAAQRCVEVRKGASEVLAVLTRGARAVFRTLIEALLGDLLHDDDEITGISYEHLFRACRERFLVSSDAALRVHLTEFKDHDMLKTKKGPDGGQLYYVPLDIADLRKLLETLEVVET